MLGHVFHANIIAYCQQNWYVRLAIYTDLFTLKEKMEPENTNFLIETKDQSKFP